MARLIDTSVVIEVERRGHSPTRLPAGLRAEGALLAAITVSELLAGIYLSTDAELRARRQVFVDGILAQFPVAPFDMMAARFHGRLVADLRARGISIGANDLLIAATALAHGHPVLTYNIRHFDRVPGLIVERPDW